MLGEDWDEIIKQVTGKPCVQDGAATLNCIPAVFQNIVTTTLVFAGIVAVFMIVFSGIKFITSGGDSKQIEGARATLTWAVIGLIVILASFFIINVVAGITGTKGIITEFGFPKQ